METKGGDAMNSMQLSCFVEVATSLSFSRAAELLHVSQPTVSHQIKTLEDELGCTLLARSTRTVRLTDDGFSFLPYAQEILALERRASEQFERGTRMNGRTIKIGVQDSYEARFVGPVIRCLCEEDPDVAPQIREGPHSALRDMLEAGAIDVIPTYRAPGGEPNTATTFKRICDMPMMCVCSETHPLAARASRELCKQDLIDVGRIVVLDPHRTSPALEAAQREIALRKPFDDILIGSSVEAALALVGAGVAYTVIPGIPDRWHEGLCSYPVSDLAPVTFGVRVRRGRRPEVFDRFIELLTELYGSGQSTDRLG